MLQGIARPTSRATLKIALWGFGRCDRPNLKGFGARFSGALPEPTGLSSLSAQVRCQGPAETLPKLGACQRQASTNNAKEAYERGYPEKARSRNTVILCCSCLYCFCVCLGGGVQKFSGGAPDALVSLHQPVASCSTWLELVRSAWQKLSKTPCLGMVAKNCAVCRPPVKMNRTQKLKNQKTSQEQ